MDIRTVAAAAGRARRRAQRGVLTVEFALLLSIFIGFIYMLAESARAMYLAVMVQEMTRGAARAAAAADFSSAAAMTALRQRAVLSGAPGGKLILGDPIDATYLRIDYLWLNAAGALVPVTAMPACPMRNLLACTADPNGASCIRFVRARLCLPGPDCAAVPYPTLIALPTALSDYVSAGLTLGPATAVAPAEALGHVVGNFCT